MERIEYEQQALIAKHKRRDESKTVNTADGVVSAHHNQY